VTDIHRKGTRATVRVPTPHNPTPAPTMTTEAAAWARSW
jgi:hypothetical protein